MGRDRRDPRSDRSNPPPVAGRNPPHNLDAEAAVISAILLSRGAMEQVLEILRPEHFYSDANGRIYGAVQELAIAGTPIDIVSVASWLRDRERLAEVGGASYIAQLADATPAVAHVTTHAGIVYEKWRLRVLIETCHRLAAEGYGDVGVAQEFIDGAAQQFNLIAERAEQSTAVTLGQAFTAGAARLAAGTAPNTITGLSTGFSAVDSATAGLHRRDVTLLGGPTGRGKTSCALCIAMHAATTPTVVDDRRVEHGVIFIGMDNMTTDEIAHRLASARARVDLVRLKTGKGTPEEWARFVAAQAELADLPILLECHRPLTPLQIRAKIRSGQAELHRRGAALSLVVIDYFQRIRADAGKFSDRDTREQKLNDAADSLLETAALFDVPMLVLVQENGEDVRDCKAAGMHAQGRWSISWKEAKAHVVVPGIVARPIARPATIKIVKGRNAKLGPCFTNFYPEYTLFTDENS